MPGARGQAEFLRPINAFAESMRAAGTAIGVRYPMNVGGYVLSRWWPERASPRQRAGAWMRRNVRLMRGAVTPARFGNACW